MKNPKIRLKKRIRGGSLETRRTCLGTHVKSAFQSVSEQANVVRNKRPEVSTGSWSPRFSGDLGDRVFQVEC